MHYITISYKLIWEFKSNTNYKISKCKKVFNTKTNREIKSCLKGGSVGYWIGKVFTPKTKLNENIQKITNYTYPF